MSLSDEQAEYLGRTFKQKVLEQAQLGMRYVMSTASLEVQPGVDLWQDCLVARMRAFVLRDHIAQDHYEETVTHPASWWQMFKRDVLPLWSRKAWEDRWPIRYDTTKVRIKVDRYLTYPDAAIRVPHMGRAYIYEEMRWD